MSESRQLRKNIKKLYYNLQYNILEIRGSPSQLSSDYVLLFFSHCDVGILSSVMYQNESSVYGEAMQS